MAERFDYLIVGSGLAGICFAEHLRRAGKRFLLFSDESQQASEVAGGLYNPLILKRFTLAHNAAEQLDYAIPFYEDLSKFLGLELDIKMRTFRIMHSVAEHNTWFEARDQRGYSRFMSDRFEPVNNPHIEAPFKLAEVLETGRLDTKLLRTAYIDYLKRVLCFRSERFNYERLEIADGYVKYDDVVATKLVFAEGYGLKANPFFNYLPLNGTKGELLLIRCPGLSETRVLKSGVFIIPLGNDLYRVGSTYKWKDKTNVPTEEAKAELLEKLKKFLTLPFEVMDHVAGVRPTVTDRKPLVGRHPQYANLFVLNGFGSRGVMIGPLAAHQLLQFIETNSSLPEDESIDRFASLYSSQFPDHTE